MENKKIKFIIPLGGLGKRFSDANYTKPKPLVSVLGKCIINWVIDCIPPHLIESITIPYHKHLEKFNFESKLIKDYPNLNIQFIKLGSNTKGAADTVLCAVNKLLEYNICNCTDNCIGNFTGNCTNNNKRLNNKHIRISDFPVICMDGDNFYTKDIFSKWQYNNGIYLFRDTEPFEIYSYSKIATNVKGQEIIKDIVEKKKISEYASTGIYTFESICKLKQYCEMTISNGEMQKGEYYMSSVIKTMIQNGEVFVPYYVDNLTYKCLGTPIQIRSFAENNSDLMTSKRYCFDLDNTLLTYPIIKDDYTTVQPIKRNIDILKKLKELGNIIIIYTARRMKTYNGNINMVFMDQGTIVFDTLKKFNIPYDELYFGKPYADYYIDDLAVSAFSTLDKELGFYDTNIKCRQFNNILYDNDIITKKSVSTESDLKGEIYYYKNIPDQLSNLFPKLLKW
jgi:capsule biosynthesis phosphatase